MSLNFLTRKLVFIVLILCGLASVYLAFWSGIQAVCGTSWSCEDFMAYMTYWIFALFVLLTPSIVTLFLPAVVFANWRRFAVVAVPIMLTATVIISLMPTQRGFIDFHIGIYLFPIFYASYFLVSSILMFRSWWNNR